MKRPREFQEEPFDLARDAQLSALLEEYQHEQCPECGAEDAEIRATRYGIEVLCAPCGALIREIDL